MDEVGGVQDSYEKVMEVVVLKEKRVGMESMREKSKVTVRIHSGLIFLFSAGILLFNNLLSYAATGAMDFDDSVGADELLLFQDMDIVLSAARQEQPENLLSVPVSVLTAEDIHYSGLVTIEEMLRFLPGVDVVKLDRNRYGVGVRGLQGSFSDRTMTLINGRPADSAAFGGSEFNMLPVMAEDIERIEVVRGPGGAAWGTNALSGVINIITKSPEQTDGVFLTSAVNHFGDSSSQVRAGLHSGKWHWLFTAGYEESHSSSDALDLDPVIKAEAGLDGSITTTEISAEDYRRKKLVRTEVQYDISDTTQMDGGVGVTDIDQGGFEMAGLLGGSSDEFTSLYMHANLKSQFSDDVNGYLRWAGRYQDMDRPSYGGANYRVNEHDIEGQLNMKLNGGHQTALGADVRFTSLYSRPLDSGAFTLAGEDSNENWVGLFGSDRWQTTEQLILELQLRGDYFSQGDLQWSGRASTLYTVDTANRHILRLSGAKAYRQPVGFIRDAWYESEQLPSGQSLYRFFVNPDTNPEQVWSLESGYQWAINDQLQFKGDLYYMWYYDLIGGRTIGPELPGSDYLFATVIENTGGAEGYGAEIQLDYTIGAFMLRSWYAYNNFSTEYEQQSIRSFLPAKNKLGITARWQVTHNWILNSQYSYTDCVKDDTTDGSVDSIHRFDFTVARKIGDIPGGNFLEGTSGEIMFGVIDVFNKDYDAVLGIDETIGHATPGRQFFARLQYQF